jgi:hypothetical protein
MSYWNSTGKFQKAYDYFYTKLVPPQGKANTDEGELLRIIGKFYYRHYNDGDDYYFCRDEWGFPDISNTIKNIDGKILYEIVSHLESNDYNLAADYALRYIMLKNSNATHIWNPNTNRLVSIATSKGRECLKLLDCKLECKLSYTT